MVIIKCKEYYLIKNIKKLIKPLYNHIEATVRIYQFNLDYNVTQLDTADNYMQIAVP